MTEEIFKSNLSWLKSKYPKSGWISLLEKGYSTVNVIFLKEAIKEAEAAIQTALPSPPTLQELDKLHIKKSNLFVARAKLSNKMMALPIDEKYNDERKNLSIEIETIQSEIENIFDEIEYGVAINRKAEKKEISATDMTVIDLFKKQNVLRASITRKKKQIVKKLSEIQEKKLKDLENQLIIINEHIEAHKNKQ